MEITDINAYKTAVDDEWFDHFSEGAVTPNDKDITMD